VSTGLEPLHAAEITAGGVGSAGGVKFGDSKSKAAAMLLA
jgi:hypothetical protein